MRHEREHHIIDFVDEMPEQDRQIFAETVYEQLDVMVPQFKDHTQRLAESHADHVYLPLPESDPTMERSWLRITHGTLEKEQEMIAGRLKYLVYLGRKDLVDDLLGRYRSGDPGTEPSR